METHKESGWVHRLTASLLLFALLYSVIGIPNFHRNVVTVASTDAVNPYNRFIWLALLAMSLPLLKIKWIEFFILFQKSWIIILLFIYFTFSTSWALDPDISRRRVMLAWIQIIIVATLTCSLRDRLLLIRFIFLVCVFTAFADLAAWVVVPGYAMTSEGLAGIQLQKNQTGLIMMYGLLAGATLLFCGPSQQKRWLIGGGLAVLFVVLLASRSKTSVAIILVIPAVLSLFSMLVRSTWATIVAIMCVAVSGMIGTAFGYLVWCDMTNDDPLAPFQKMTFTGRTDLWTFMLGEIQKHPWLGAGFSSFWAINPGVQPSLKTSMWFGSDALINEAHNGYLDLIATGGLVGFVLGVSVLIYAIILAIKAIANTPVYSKSQSTIMTRPLAFFHLGFLLALGIHNFTESNLFSNSNLLAVALYFSFFDLAYWKKQQAMLDPARQPWERWNNSSASKIDTTLMRLMR